MAHRPANEQWEYKFAHCEEKVDVFTEEEIAAVIAQRTDWLNAFGADGWELIKITFGTNGYVAVLLKRRCGF